MRDQLKKFNGAGIVSTPLSTSNLYTPEKNTVLQYLSGDEDIFSLLESRLCEYHDAQYCVLFSTGFWALVASIQLNALPGKTQVIIPSLTYRRLADVVYWAGLVPVFVDVDADTLAVSPTAIKNNITDQTALILAVHPIINCCEVDSIIELSKNLDIPLVFDAVESVHETYKGRRIGSFGVCEVFSMHASKLINGLEGGYVCTNDKVLALALNRFKCGLNVQYEGRTFHGLNGLPCETHSAFALAGIDEIEKNIEHNHLIYQKYKEYFQSIPGVDLCLFNENEQTSYKNIVVEIRVEFPITRDQLVVILNNELILARKYYMPALHNKHYLYPVVITDMKNTDYAERCYLNLPCGSRVATKDVSLICQLIKYIAGDPESFV